MRARMSACESARISAASVAALRAPQAPTATVATGMPGGIWTIEYSASMPFSSLDASGTPMTGSGVYALQTPGSAAAPPAAAMITSKPRSRADETNSRTLSGVRCADITCTSCSIPNFVSVSMHACMTSMSDFDPISTATSALIR